MIFRVAIALFRQLSQRLKSYETELQHKQQTKILVIQFLIKQWNPPVNLTKFNLNQRGEKPIRRATEHPTFKYNISTSFTIFFTFMHLQTTECSEDA